MVNGCSTESIAKAVREYAGVTRKRAIGEITRVFRFDSSDVVASFGEDAALIKNNDEGILLAADGIWSRLMEADPYWSGYCAVLVNVHDIAAMGGRPMAIVDILSVKNEKVCREVLRGMVDASNQFGVPVVGGHLHPDAESNAIDVAIMGIVRMDEVILSSTAKEGDHVIAAFDLRGRVHPSCVLNWDSATLHPAEEVRAQIAVMQGLGHDHLVTAGKDISNPGVIGTLGMLLETSEKGAVIDLAKIPHPDLRATGITFEHWVRMYPGMGFILTVRPEHAEEVCQRFEDVHMTAADIGTVNSSRRLNVVYNGEETSVFDLGKEGIMRLFTDKNRD